MSINLISFPFRIEQNGSVATKLDGDPDYYAEELAVLTSTEIGERILVPTYGIEDPTFDDFPTATLALQVAKFGPPVQIIDVITNVITDGSTEVTVYFDASANNTAPDTDLGG